MKMRQQIRADVTIRPFEERDYSGAVAVSNAVFPDSFFPTRHVIESSTSMGDESFTFLYSVTWNRLSFICPPVGGIMRGLGSVCQAFYTRLGEGARTHVPDGCWYANQ